MIAAFVLGGCSSDNADWDVFIPETGGPLYGGELLLDAVIRPDLTEMTTVTAFVVDSVDPTDNRFGAYTNLSPNAPEDGSTVCSRYDPDKQNRWPLQDLNLEANEETLDVGATMTFSDGEGTDYVLNRNANGMDTEGRTHDFVYSYSREGLPPPAKKWTTTFETPVEAFTEILEDGTYSPTNIDWGSPAYNADGIIVDRSQAMTITWTQTDPAASRVGTDHFNMLAIYSVPGGPPEQLRWICQTEKDGEMTVPQDVISTFPDQGLFIIANVAHFQPKGTNRRVLHQIGRFRRMQLFTAQN